MRCAAVWTVLTVAAGGLVWWLRVDVAVASAPSTLADALARVAAVGATACTLWLWCVATLTIGEAVDLRTRRDERSRSLVRRLVLVACGAAIVGGTAVPSQAAGHDAGDSARGDRTTADALSGLSLPERQPGTGRVPGPPTRSTPGGHAEAEHGERVVVRLGDSLWSLARDRVPDGDPATIDALWRRIHAVNRAVIGPDPDVILPGQRLVVPEVPR